MYLISHAGFSKIGVNQLEASDAGSYFWLLVPGLPLGAPEKSK